MPFPGRGQNPYLQLLYDALARAGVEIVERSAKAPDFVHYHWPENAIAHHNPLRQLDRSLWFFSRLLAQRARGSAIIWTFHNASQHDASWQALQAWARRRMLSQTDIVLINFDSAREHLAQVYGRHEDVWYVPHGSYHGYYPADRTRAEARSRLGLPDDALVFMSFGDLRPYKNLETVIGAFRRFAAPHAHLLLAGGARDAAYGRKIRALCDGDQRIVAHLGRVEDADVQSYFRASDLLVLAREPFSSGTAVLAYDFSLPLLSPRINHVAELSRGRACLHLADTSEEGVLRAFQYASATDLSVHRRDAARSRSADWDSIAAQLAKQLREYLSHRNGHA